MARNQLEERLEAIRNQKQKLLANKQVIEEKIEILSREEMEILEDMGVFKGVEK